MKADVPIAAAISILQDFVELGFGDQVPYACDCGRSIESFPLDHCPSCGAIIDEEKSLFVRIPGVSEAEAQKRDAISYIIDTERRRVADAWDRSGKIFYLMLDLARSEKIQEKLGDIEYQYLLSVLRDLLWNHCLTQSREAYTSVGEVGDLHKILFSDLGDVYTVLTRFAKELGSLAGQRSDLPYDLPKYSAQIQSLQIQKAIGETKATAFDLFTTTLTGAKDINTVELTKYYRIDHVISLRDEVYDVADIAIVFFEQTKPDFVSEIPTAAWYPFHYNKYSIENVDLGAIAYVSRDGGFSIEDDPKRVLDTDVFSKN